MDDAADGIQGTAAPPADFDEATYLRLNPDVAGAVADGGYASGLDHYVKNGAQEQRHYRFETAKVADPVVVDADPAPPPGRRLAPMQAYCIEAVRMSPSGGVFLTGWIDDAADPLAELLLEGEGWQCDLLRTSLARTRRRDVEATLGSRHVHAYGLLAFLDLGRETPRHGACRLRLTLRGGATVTFDVGVTAVGDFDLRDSVLTALVESDWFASAHVGAMAGLAGGLGAQIVAHNRRLTAGIVARPYVERFGPIAGRPAGSILVCLYGRADYLALQNTLFAGGAGMADYEFVFVSNSPELADRLRRDARIGSLVHGTRQTLVLLHGNAGFGAANNVAVAHAASDRIIACNPDVVPYQADWAQRHSDAVAGLPTARTDVFGVPLFYDSGSLMHAGMYFEIDTAVVPTPGGLLAQDMVRVQHYGKGAPPAGAELARSGLLRARPVPAVTGAFMSWRRDWFERLGGFSEDFVFGHYEDADLCLRSLAAGVAPWLHDIRMYHLEGRGSTRASEHEGALFVNRWLFAQRWAAGLRQGLLGPHPTHPLLAEPLPA